MQQKIVADLMLRLPRSVATEKRWNIICQDEMKALQDQIKEKISFAAASYWDSVIAKVEANKNLQQSQNFALAQSKDELRLSLQKLQSNHAIVMEKQSLCNIAEIEQLEKQHQKRKVVFFSMSEKAQQQDKLGGRNLWDEMIPVHLRRHALSFLPLCKTEKEWKSELLIGVVATRESVFMQAVPVHLRTSLSFDEIFGSEENIDRHLKSIEEVQRVIKAFNVGNGHRQSKKGGWSYGTKLLKQKAGKKAGNSTPYVASSGSKSELVKRLREIVVERVPSAKAAADAKAQETAKAQAATNGHGLTE